MCDITKTDVLKKQMYLFILSFPSYHLDAVNIIFKDTEYGGIMLYNETEFLNHPLEESIANLEFP